MSDRRKSNTQNSKPSKKSRKAPTLEIKNKVFKLHNFGLKVHELANKF
jgi:hypothetical protein